MEEREIQYFEQFGDTIQDEYGGLYSADGHWLLSAPTGRRKTYRIKEGDKDRLQKFRGVVIQERGATPATRTFTVRKVSGGIGVERIFPMQSPFIDSIELNKVGKVRRSRIFYLRKLSGKKARIKERKLTVLKDEGAKAEA
jgi:large subunit ribosomal protein L19